MTKIELAKAIARQTGQENAAVLTTLNEFMEEVKYQIAKGETIYLRGFGTFQRRHRSTKKARDIKRNTTIVVEAHNVPVFKPSIEFVEKVKNRKGDLP